MPHQAVCEALSRFGVPEWAGFTCPSCSKDVPPVASLSIGIDLSPLFFGDLTVTSVCPHCDSLCEVHYRAAFVSMPELGFVPDKKPVPRSEIVKKGEVKIVVR